MPRSASSSPTSVLSSVVLPAPLRPSTSIRSPRPTSNVTSSNTVLRPNALARSSTSSATRPARGGSGSRTRTLRSARAAVTRLAVQLLDAVVERLGGARPLLGLAAHRVGERAAAGRSRWSGAPRAWCGARASAWRGDEVLRVRAAVLDELALVDVQHARDRLVEQLEVVADHEQRAAVRPQELHEPLLGVDVEVVGRLVEQQQVAAREQDARELDPPALAAGERGDRQVEPVGAEPEAGRDAPDLGVGGVAARVAERVLGVAVRAHVARRRVVGHALVQLVEPAARGVEPARRQHVRERGAVDAGAARRRVLREVPDRAGARDDARRGGRLADEHLQQRRLADAVATDEADLVAGAQREGRAGQRVPATHFHGEIAHLEHG